jgi:hypothetical protein
MSENFSRRSRSVDSERAAALNIVAVCVHAPSAAHMLGDAQLELAAMQVRFGGGRRGGGGRRARNGEPTRCPAARRFCSAGTPLTVHPPPFPGR